MLLAAEEMLRDLELAEVWPSSDSMASLFDEAEIASSTATRSDGSN